MTTQSAVRRAAFVLLRAALMIAPARGQDWGRAMLMELDHVKDSWTAWAWAIGCSTVLVKQAAFGLLFSPWRTDKAVRAAVAVLLCLALLFLAVPTFRQALNVTLSSWEIAVDEQRQSQAGRESGWPDPELGQIILSAESERDAKALAFVATRLTNDRESARLADEAVNLDPSLRWLYSIVATRHWRLPEIPRWMERLEHWDRQNAVPYLIAAATIDHAHTAGGDLRENSVLNDPTWQLAMSGVYGASKFDDYLSRQFAVDREVVLHYRLSDPLVFLRGFDDNDPDGRVPGYAYFDILNYGRLIVGLGRSAEANGDTQAASMACQRIAAFGHILESQGGSEFLRSAGASLADDAVALEKSPVIGRQPILVPAYRQRLVHWQEQIDAARSRLRFVQVSTLSICGFFFLLLLFGPYLIGRNVTVLKRRVALAGAAGLLLSSIALYAAYRPYAVMLNGFIDSGNPSQIQALRVLLPSGLGAYGKDMLRFYVWAGFTLAGTAALLTIAARRVLSRFRTGVSA